MLNSKLVSTVVYHLKHNQESNLGFRYVELTYDGFENEIILIEYDTSGDLNHDDRKDLETKALNEINSVLKGFKFQLSYSFYNRRDRLTFYGTFQKDNIKHRIKKEQESIQKGEQDV